ncbi:MAG: hypothetical protein AAGE52_26555 [Myxococcota bacterium]
MIRLFLLVVVACGVSRPAATPERAPQGDRAPRSPWDRVSLGVLGEASPSVHPSFFFVSQSEPRVLRINRDDGGWWTEGALVPIDRLRSDAQPVASGDLSVAATLETTDGRPAMHVWNLRDESVVRSEPLTATPLWVWSETEVGLVSPSGEVKIWNREGAQRELESHVEDAVAAALSGDGRTVALWRMEPTPTVHVVGERPRREVPAPAEPEIRKALQLSHDGARLAFGAGSVVRVVNTRSGEQLAAHEIRGEAQSFSFGPRDQLFVGNESHYEPRARVFGEGRARALPLEERSLLTRVRWGESSLIASGPDALVRWEGDAFDCRFLRSIPRRVLEVRALEAPMVEVSTRSTVYRFDLQARRLVDCARLEIADALRRQLRGRGVPAELSDIEELVHPGQHMVLDVHGERRLLATREGSVLVERASPSWRVVRELPSFQSFRCLESCGERRFAADGSWFVAAAPERELGLYRSSNGELLDTLPMRGPTFRFTVREDVVVLRNPDRIRTFRVRDERLHLIGEHRGMHLDSWAFGESRMLVGDRRRRGWGVQQLSLPDLVPIGGERLVDGAHRLDLLILDEQRFVAISRGQLHVVDLLPYVRSRPL